MWNVRFLKHAHVFLSSMKFLSLGLVRLVTASFSKEPCRSIFRGKSSFVCDVCNVRFLFVRATSIVYDISRKKYNTNKSLACCGNSIHFIFYIHLSNMFHYYYFIIRNKNVQEKCIELEYVHFGSHRIFD